MFSAIDTCILILATLTVTSEKVYIAGICWHQEMNTENIWKSETYRKSYIWEPIYLLLLQIILLQEY